MVDEIDLNELTLSDQPPLSDETKQKLKEYWARLRPFINKPTRDVSVLVRMGNTMLFVCPTWMTMDAIHSMTQAWRENVQGYQLLVLPNTVFITKEMFDGDPGPSDGDAQVGGEVLPDGDEAGGDAGRPGAEALQPGDVGDQRAGQLDTQEEPPVPDDLGAGRGSPAPRRRAARGKAQAIPEDQPNPDDLPF